MWGVIGRKFLPVVWLSIVLNPSENKVVSRALCRHRKSQKTMLVSSGTKRTHEKPRYRRAERHSEFLHVVDPVPVHGRGFYAEEVLAGLVDDGFRLRRISPRPYRRELIKNTWVVDVETQKLERSPVAVAKLVTRQNPTTGERERVYADEVNDVPNAWHYLPSSEVVRLLEYVRRDSSAGLTACERRWLKIADSPGQCAIMPLRSVRGD
jgi:hypothetical protein